MYRIMVVEDDTMVQRMMQDILKPEGFEVMVYPEGQKALNAAPNDKPDLILLDINLPDLSGMEVCRALKADGRTKHIPVLMLTGEAREVISRVEGLDSGAEDYLFKPVSARVLIARIRSILKSETKPI